MSDQRENTVAASIAAIAFSRAKVMFAEMCHAEVEKSAGGVEQGAIVRVMKGIPAMKPDDRLLHDLESFLDASS